MDSIARIRDEVRTWLAQAWDPTLTVREWWAQLADSGWAFPHWPQEWFGKGFTSVEAAVVYETLAEAEVLGPPVGSGPSMGANVLLAYGTEDQKREWLPRLARGEEMWCQFFSEPGAGSDLASIQTRAVRDGDEWVINGQKVWNSSTLIADRGLLVTRSDPDLPKHRGISFFIVDVDQPGIDIRPIRQMNGRSEFNETFFTDARVHDRARIGAVNDGFRVAITTLSTERATFAGGGERQLVTAHAGRKGGDLDRMAAEVLSRDSATDIVGANALPIGDADAMISLARQFGRLQDPSIRQRIARLVATSESLRFTELRARAAAEAGRTPGPESSIAYLGGVRVIRQCRDLSAEIAGAAATLDGPDAVMDGTIALTITTAPCHGIQGGSEQIQLNIIGERLLGLPKEPSVDRDLPFRDILSLHARPGEQGI
jgi:alkylation response protein AidB-like acyl-CoA dehydrogenase